MGTPKQVSTSQTIYTRRVCSDYGMSKSKVQAECPLDQQKPTQIHLSHRPAENNGGGGNGGDSEGKTRTDDGDEDDDDDDMNEDDDHDEDQVKIADLGRGGAAGGPVTSALDVGSAELRTSSIIDTAHQAGNGNNHRADTAMLNRIKEDHPTSNDPSELLKTCII